MAKPKSDDPIQNDEQEGNTPAPADPSVHLERIEDLEAEVELLKIENELLRKQANDNKFIDEENPDSVNVPRRMTANFSIAGGFGFISKQMGDVIDDPLVIEILRANDAPMVRA